MTAPRLLTRNEIEAAFRLLGELARAEGQSLEILAFGGTAMVLGFDARASTRDVDYAPLPTTDNPYLRQLALQVAGRFGWNDDWLNDGGKGYLHTRSLGPEIYQSDGIRVLRPTTGQLLAMKLVAWRDDVDVSDAALLLKELNPPSCDDAWQMVESFVIPGMELKARYALDDLWQHRD
jgi:hypothetical protein